MICFLFIATSQQPPVGELAVIQLIRTEKSVEGEQVQEALKELVVAHQVVTLAPGVSSPLNGTPLPAIVDGDRVISGQAALDAYLAELGEVTARWRRFQADACYLDDEGNVC
jgi:hypothetical protein